MRNKTITRESLPFDRVSIGDLDRHAVIEFKTIRRLHFDQRHFAVIKFWNGRIDFVIDKDHSVYKSNTAKNALDRLRKLNLAINEIISSVRLIGYASELATAVKMLIDKHYDEAVAHLKMYLTRKRKAQQNFQKSVYYGFYFVVWAAILAVLIVHPDAKLFVLATGGDAELAYLAGAWWGISGGLFSILTAKHKYKPRVNGIVGSAVINSFTRVIVAAFTATLLLMLVVGVLNSDPSGSWDISLILLMFFSGTLERVVPLVDRLLRRNYAFFEEL